MSEPTYQVCYQLAQCAKWLTIGDQNVNWALTGLAAALTAGRYVIRGYSSRRFQWDDAVHLVAFLLLVVHGATNQLTAAAKAQLAIDEKPSTKISTDALLAEFHYVYQLNTVNNVFLYLVFWVIKVAFLMFYRMLFGSSARFMRVWWVVFIFTVLTYFIPFGGVIATCFGETTVAGYKQCNSPDQTRAIKLEYSCAFNVATDVFIMALPLWMIRDLQMKAGQKVALAFVFSVAIFCVALDILRVVEALASNQNLYTVLEINMVVVISCLPTYGTLLSIRERMRSRKASYRSYESGSRGSKPSRRSGSKVPDPMPISVIQSFSDESQAIGKFNAIPAAMEKAVAVPDPQGQQPVDEQHSHQRGPTQDTPPLAGSPPPRELSPDEAAHVQW